jgi:hypothetical protein
MSNIKYFYIRQPDKKNPNHRGAPVACVAYQRAKDPDVADTEIVYFALSVANPDADEFTKKKARQIASGQLTCVRNMVDGFQLSDKATSTDVIRELVTRIEDNDTTVTTIPSRVRHAAKAWLKKTTKKVEA